MILGKGPRCTHELYSIAMNSSTSTPAAVIAIIVVVSAEVARAKTAQPVPMAPTADEASIIGVISSSLTEALHEKANGLPLVVLGERRRAKDRARGRRVNATGVTRADIVCFVWFLS